MVRPRFLPPPVSAAQGLLCDCDQKRGRSGDPIAEGGGFGGRGRSGSPAGGSGVASSAAVALPTFSQRLDKKQHMANFHQMYREVIDLGAGAAAAPCVSATVVDAWCVCCAGASQFKGKEKKVWQAQTLAALGGKVSDVVLVLCWWQRRPTTGV